MGAGAVTPTPEGPVPLTWAEIGAFARIEGLDRDEAQALRAMSVAYLDGMKRGESPLGIPPWERD